MLKESDGVAFFCSLEWWPDGGYGRSGGTVHGIIFKELLEARLFAAALHDLLVNSPAGRSVELI